MDLTIAFKNIFKKQPVETGCANDYKRIVLYQTILFSLL